MRELFVYYRIRPGAEQAAHEAVMAMQLRLRGSHSGLEARLLKRFDAAPTGETWMETYAVRAGGIDIAPTIDDAFEADLVIHAVALEPFIDGGRHMERFEAIDPR